MRKLIYSLIIIDSFIFYAIYQSRLGPSADALSPVSVVAPPAIPVATTNEPPSNANDIATTPTPIPIDTTPTPTPTNTPTNTPTPSPTPKPTPTPAPTPAPKPKGQYKDGSYTGSVADAYYGNIQVKVTISGGKITDVIFLQYPNDRSTSRSINSQAMPYLKAEAIQAQSANVAIVSGASDSSAAFQQSLASALAQAKN